jgi:NAD(P)-dependent dehydrogenase (short-subunit alcohol dehydrogenase family)
MGMAAARRLAQRHRVLIADIDPGRAVQAAEALRLEGGDATGIACDITDSSAVDAMVRTVDALGGFRVLAHVAGLSPSMGDFRAIIRVNLIGAATVADCFLSRASQGSAAILISSLAGHYFQCRKQSRPCWAI